MGVIVRRSSRRAMSSPLPHTTARSVLDTYIRAHDLSGVPVDCWVTVTTNASAQVGIASGSARKCGVDGHEVADPPASSSHCHRWDLRALTVASWPRLRAYAPIADTPDGLRRIRRPRPAASTSTMSVGERPRGRLELWHRRELGVDLGNLLLDARQLGTRDPERRLGFQRYPAGPRRAMRTVTTHRRPPRPGRPRTTCRRPGTGPCRGGSGCDAPGRTRGSAPRRTPARRTGAARPA